VSWLCKSNKIRTPTWVLRVWSNYPPSPEDLRLQSWVLFQPHLLVSFNHVVGTFRVTVGYIRIFLYVHTRHFEALLLLPCLPPQWVWVSWLHKSNKTRTPRQWPEFESGVPVRGAQKTDDDQDTHETTAGWSPMSASQQHRASKGSGCQQTRQEWQRFEMAHVCRKMRTWPTVTRNVPTTWLKDTRRCG